MYGYEKVDEEEKLLVLDGWNPLDTIYLCAMCNNTASHILLATLAIKVAEIVEGMIELEGITGFTTNQAVLTMEGHIKVNDSDYVVKPGYLAYWLGEEDFRLLK